MKHPKTDNKWAFTEEEQAVINRKFKDNHWAWKLAKLKSDDSRAVSVRIEPRIKEALQNYSSNSGRPQNEIIRKAIKDYLSPKDKSFNTYKATIPRTRHKNGDRKPLITFRLNISEFNQLDLLCRQWGYKKSYIIENALYHLLFRSKSVSKTEREIIPTPGGLFSDEKLKNAEARKLRRVNDVSVTVTIDPRIRDAMKHYSEKSEWSQADITRKALKDYLTAMEEHREESFYELRTTVPRNISTENKRTYFTFRIDKYDFHNLEKFSEKSGRTKSFIVENALYQLLESKPINPSPDENNITA